MNRRKFLFLAGGVATPVAAAGIGLRLLPDDSPDTSTPSVRWGEESCDHCRMVISDRRFAAAWIEPGGQQSRFDDAGCMVSTYREHPPADGTRLFVRDFADDGWLDATTATYFQADSIHSPMAYGVAAFKNRAAGVAELGHTAPAPRRWDDLVHDLERMG